MSYVWHKSNKGKNNVFIIYLTYLFLRKYTLI